MSGRRSRRNSTDARCSASSVLTGIGNGSWARASTGSGHLARIRSIECIGDLDGDGQRFLQRQARAWCNRRRAISQRVRVSAPHARQPIRQRLALEVLHDEEVRDLGFTARGVCSPARCRSAASRFVPVAGLLADVVQRADMRMIERRDRAGLAVEPFAELRIAASFGGRTLIATIRSRRVSRAR
jgi:hypothetical protein